ncbi:MAG: hypothetical protein LUG84_03180 [Akkermansiaceae bacterium]|nr:hypothetical protein [Akkermansiaceae bacterium]
MNFLSTTILLIIVLDPIGLAIMMPALTRHVPASRVPSIIVREMVIALLVLLLFLFAGNYLLQILGLERATLNISGAVVLFLIALGMVFPGFAQATSAENDIDADREPFIVPIAVPLFAGPSGIAVVMLHGAQIENVTGFLLFTGSLLTAWLCSLVIVLTGPKLLKRLGRRGAIALERLVGILLILISVQMFFDGLHIASI